MGMEGRWRRRVVHGLLAMVLGVAAWWGLTRWGGSQQACWMGGIMVVAVVLWLTEAVPLFVTSLWVVLLEIVLLGNPGGWQGLGSEHGQGWRWTSVLGAAMDPVLVLFAGGLVLARCMVKQGLDRAASAWLVGRLGGSPGGMLLGVMLATSMLGMWMSNTATASLMLALVGPMRRGLPEGDGMRKALVLGVAFAANLSGLGTPVASPPNAVASELLRAAGHPVTFLGWMRVGVPLSAGLTLLAWAVLRWRHGSGPWQGMKGWAAPKVGWGGAWVAMVFAGTAGLWMTEGLHGLPPSVVALGSWAVLGLSGMFTAEDMAGMEWRVLMLIGGGLALGAGVRETGLGAWLIGGIPAGGTSLLAALVLGTFVTSTFMSSTAAANVMLPMSMAASVGGTVHPVLAAMGVAMASSMAMALPASTPPNALAHAEGEVTSMEMARASLWISAAGLCVLLVAGRGWWGMAGLL